MPADRPHSPAEQIAKPGKRLQRENQHLLQEHQVIRIFDKKHNTLVYVAVSTKLVEGSLQNSISTVPIMPLGGK
ncbi:MAG: CreA family protein [Syntrophobacteraceae bacterium]